MRKLTVLLLALFCVTATVLAQKKAISSRNAPDSVTTAVAVFVASNMKMAVNNAIADITEMGIPCDTAALRSLIFKELQRPYSAEAHKHANAVIDNTIRAMALRQSDSLLVAAAKAPGAVTLPSGVVIRTLQAGEGPTPAPTDEVSIRYTGRLADGSVFDSIPDNEAPLTALATGFTPGFNQAIAGMRAGGKYVVTIPAPLAYGSQGVQGVIPPDAALQFDVEMIRITKK